MARTTAPQFVHIGGRILNVDQIKWIGMQKQQDEDPRVYVEFTTGGWTVLEKGLTLTGVVEALNGAVF
jgi:hypothetical protein